MSQPAKAPLWYGETATVREVPDSSYGEGNAVEVSQEKQPTIVLTGALLKRLAGMVR